ncbi:MAG: GntR family transcriptional regulator [Acidimicrobiia bacterium]|jgi:DNA-binding GntR family transcriptional regulator
MTDSGRPQQEPLEREILAERVKDRILTWILEGELAPGSRIIETRVARELGMSQGPVREALRSLATLGFVEMEPYRGSRVRKPSSEELVEAMEVRAELEAMAGRLVASRSNKKLVKDLEAAYAEMLEAADAGNAHDHAVKNTDFHALIVEASGNQTLFRVWSMLEPFARTYVTASTPGIDLHWLAERHRVIIDAISEGDEDRAAEAMRVHAAEAEALIDPALDHD